MIALHSFLAEDAVLGQVREALQSSCGARFRAEPQTAAVAYDTFDWRLFNGGQELWVEERSALELLWIDRSRGPCARYSIASAPHFAADLPSEGAREALAPLLEERALLPVARVERRAERLDLKNSQQKVVARVLLLRRKALKPAGKAGGEKLPTLVAVETVRGYDEGELLARWIATDLGLVPHALDDLQESARAIGKEPGYDPTKLRFTLDPSLATFEALRAVLGTLLTTVRALERGTRENIDAEFLHDFRVAVRRARSLMKPFREALPVPSWERLSEGLRELATATGEPRDLDVLALRSEGYLSELGEPREVFAPLLEQLEKKRDRAHESLRSKLDSPSYAELIKSWQELLNAPPSESAEASEPISKTAAARIWKRYKKMRKKGAAALASPSEQDLHPLRIQGKKLRYLLELFPGVFSAEEVDQAIDLLKDLQNNLGDINDLKVHEEFFQAAALKHLSDGPSLMAAGRLTGHLARLRREELAQTSKLLSRFTGEKARSLYTRIFAPGLDLEPAS